MGFFVEHIGWVTKDLEAFEEFWVGILGYQRVKDSYTPHEVQQSLFGLSGKARVIRYRGPVEGPDVEVHLFENPSLGGCFPKFNRYGLNHICLGTGGPGSRDKFLKSLPSHIDVRIYDNPRGWQNVFIQDYEGNWIELREQYD